MATRAFTGSDMVSTKDLQWPTGSAEYRATRPADLSRREAMDAVFSVTHSDSPTIKVGDQIIQRDIDAPSADKGALWACAPDSLQRGDVLLFSRFPTTIPYQLGGNVASEDVAGRSFPTLQNLGAKGVRIELSLLFYDAWVDTRRYSPAAAAKLWFDMYVIGHDGTGASVPYAHIYYQVGGAPPIRVMIEDVAMETSHYLRNAEPQSVEAKVRLVVWEPVYLMSPFRPKSPPTSRTNKPNPSPVCVCPEVVVCLPGQNSGVNVRQSANAQAADTGGLFGQVFNAMDEVRRQSTLNYSPAVGGQ